MSAIRRRNGKTVNDQSQFDTHVVTLTVLPNDGTGVTVINPITLPTLADGTNLTFTAYAVAPSVGGTATPLTYSLGAGAPSGASINAQTGQVTWTPSQVNQQAPGTYTIPVLATETNNPLEIGSASFTITVGGSSTDQGSGLATRQTVALGLTHSPKYYTNFVTAAYSQYLDRTPDAAGLAYWVNQMQNNGLSDEQLEAGFISSPEFIADHGGGGASLVQGLYQALLGRSAQPNEVQYWLDQLNAGMTVEQVALGFTTSPEREGQRVQADYQTYLGRGATTTEVQYWVNLFENGGSNEQVVAGFISSQEYFQTNGGDNIVDWLYADYRTVLQREPDNAGLQFWENQLH